jgi:hypothetical protein
VDDTLTMLPASLGQHHAQLMLHAEQRTQDIGVEGRGVGFCRLFRHRAGCAFGSNAIDSSIQATKARDGLIDQATHVVLVTHVGAQEFGLSTKLLQFSDESLAFFITSSGNHDTGTFARESQGGGASDPCQRASNQHHGGLHAMSPSG